MKKRRCFAGLLALAILLLSSCDGAAEMQSSETSTTMAETTSPENVSTDEADVLPQYIPGTIKLTPSDITTYHFGVPHYRAVYYELGDVVFDMGVSVEEFDQWQREIEPDFDYLHERQEMSYVTFVKKFNVPKEIFAKAIEEEKQRYRDEGWDLTLEQNELPNPDIVYTFDNEIINAYYERDDIYKPGEMEYTSESPVEPPQYIPGSIQLNQEDWKYRFIYYTVPGWTAYLVTNEELLAWLETRDTGPDYIDGKMVEPERMVLLDFIQDFDIPREDFAGARALAEERYTAYGVDLTREENELPNTDVLYTFDEDIINAYYARSNG